jgi:hypothetical protein
VTPATCATQNLRPREQFQVWQEWFAPLADVFPLTRLSVHLGGSPAQTNAASKLRSQVMDHFWDAPHGRGILSR